MSEDIRLTPEELAAIKDEVRFRENTTLTLKTILARLEKQNGQIEKLVEKTTRHDVHINIQYWLLCFILTGIIGFAWFVLRGGG